jgi:hypothetical protein
VAGVRVGLKALLSREGEGQLLNVHADSAGIGDREFGGEPSTPVT